MGEALGKRNAREILDRLALVLAALRKHAKGLAS